MLEFKQTNFVQVEHHKRIDSGEVVTFWRNALYVGLQDGSHTVIYTDGSLEVLHKGVVIRAAA